MQVPENEVTWTYSLLQASENKQNARTGTPHGASAELVGIDGSNNGGLKPFAGFRKVRNFSPELATGWSGSNPYTSLAHKCRVVDFWSFSLVTSANVRVYGYLYVVRRANSGSCSNVYDLVMDYYAPQGGSSSWSSIVVQQGMSDGGILSDGGKAVMSVETTSKAVYVFRRGVAPIAIYFKYTTGPVATTPNIINPAGPGKKVYSSAETAQFNTGTSHSYLAFIENPTTTNTNYTQGAVVFSFSSVGTASNHLLTISNFNTAPKLTAGTYSLAVQFEDSRSGRKSQITKNCEITFSGAEHCLFVDGYLDNTKFDTLNIYRSVRTENAGGAFTGGILQLEASVPVSSYTVTASQMQDVTDNVATHPLSTASNYTYFRYAYQLNDSSLVMQDVFLDKPSYSETMPKGGAGALLDGTMLVSNISENSGDLTGTGETRWSASGVDSPELFSASGIYKPANVGDAVTCFKRTGQIMAGLTRNGVQFFSKENGFVRVLAAHQGYGVTGPYAATTVGPVTYYMNYRGLKAVYPDGRLDDVTAINQLISDEWASNGSGVQDLSKVSMAFDAATLTMYILNPVRQHAVLFWFSTGVVSELQDMSFGKVTQGWWEDTDGQLVPRALFLFNSPYPDLVSNTSFRPAIYMPCRSYDDKSDPENDITTPCCMLDANVNRNPQTTPTYAEGSELFYYDDTCTQQSIASYEATNVFGVSGANAAKLIGMWVYAISPVSNGYVRSRIIDASTSLIIYTGVETYSASSGTGVTPAGAGFEAGTKLALDPVYFRWIGGPMRTSQDAMEELAVRQPTSMGVVLSDFDYTDAVDRTPVAFYWVGSLYRNNDMTPLLSAAPTNTDGTSSIGSLSLGDSANWAGFGKHSYMGQWFFPGFQTFVPNVQYRLVGAQVKGRMLPTDRTRRTY